MGGALREFTTRESHCFAQIKDNSDGGGRTLFTSQERQWLVLQVSWSSVNVGVNWAGIHTNMYRFRIQILQGLRAGPNDMDVLKEEALVEEGQSILAAWQESGLVYQIFPLHETAALTQLKSSWVKNVFAPQPLGMTQS